MLEKLKGIIDLAKLWVILLLEVDFNSLNKIIFNRRVVLTIEKKQLIPYEIIEGRYEHLAIYVALNKKLVSDVANQQKELTVIISANAANYYDRIPYPIIDLLYWSFSLGLEYVILLFRIIQTLNIFSRTSFSLLNSFYTSSKLKLF